MSGHPVLTVLLLLVPPTALAGVAYAGVRATRAVHHAATRGYRAARHAIARRRFHAAAHRLWRAAEMRQQLHDRQQRGAQGAQGHDTLPLATILGLGLGSDPHATLLAAAWAMRDPSGDAGGDATQAQTQPQGHDTAEEEKGGVPA